MRFFLLFFPFVFALSLCAQRIYTDPHSLLLMRRSLHYIYNVETESATLLIDSLKKVWPRHPAPDLLQGLQMYWEESMISSESEKFKACIASLSRAVRKAKKLRKTGDIEAILFETSARGILVDRYANEGNYLKAIGQARILYKLSFIADRLRKKNIDFYFITGLYNYFREKYPEDYPIYRPFVAVLRKGNKQLGIQQIDTAARLGVLSRPEANTYLSDIYLLYEGKPYKALPYLKRLHEEFPGNLWYTTRLAEAYVGIKEYATSEPLIEEILRSPLDYYQLSGHYLKGYVEERRHRRLEMASIHYKAAITHGNRFKHKGSFFRASAYLGLARIAEQRGEKKKAIERYRKAYRSTRHAKPRAEARKALRRLRR